MAFGFDDIMSWLGETASSAGQGVADTATAVGQGFSDAATGVGNYLENLTGSFGADPTSAQLPVPPEGANIYDHYASDPSVPVAGSSSYNPDFSGVTAGTDRFAGAGAPLPLGVSPSTPILSAGADPYGAGGAMKSAAFGATPAGGDWTSGGSSGIGGFLKNNASWLLPAGGLGVAALKSQQTLPGTATLKANAAALSGAAQPLMDPLLKGTALPGNAQGGLDAAAASLTASIRSQHANSGTSGSSMEAQELAQVPLMMQQQQLAEAKSLYDVGLKTMGMADDATQQIIKNTLQQDTNLTNALARVAASMAPTALKDLTKVD